MIPGSMEAAMFLLAFANSFFCFSLNKVYQSGIIFRVLFFALRLAITLFYLNLMIQYGIYDLFANNLWFLISLFSIAIIYTTFWHFYYLLTRERSVLLGAELIDLFAGSLGFLLSFWYLGVILG